MAENSGGAHCLKNGFTVNHVTGLEVVLPDGEVVELGGKALDPDGPDLLGAFVGSEGTLGIATEITLRVVRKPEAVTHAARGVPVDRRGRRGGLGDHRGRDPAGRDRDDGPAHDRGGRAGVPPGLPRGRRGAAPRRARRDRRAGRRGRCGASTASAPTAARSRCGRRATTPSARSSGSAARAPSPRWAACRPTTTSRTGSSRGRSCPRCCGGSAELSREHGLRVGNVFHAGDGNLHPLVLYDAAKGETEAAKELAEAILGACLDAGGSLTGEHGVGVDKACSMPQMFSERDLEAFERLRRAFDPAGLANPGKVLPTPRLCGEVPGPYRAASARADRRCRASLASRRRPTRSRAASAEGRDRPDRRRPRRRRAWPACSSTRPAT